MTMADAKTMPPRLYVDGVAVEYLPKDGEWHHVVLIHGGEPFEYDLLKGPDEIFSEGKRRLPHCGCDCAVCWHCMKGPGEHGND